MLTGFIYNAFGFYFTVSVMESVVALLLLSWLIFLLSMIIFKAPFTRVWLENVFIILVGFPTFMQLFAGSWGFLLLFEGGVFYKNKFPLESIFSITFDLFFPLLLFFSVYLIDFIVRLVRHKQDQATVFVGK